jgi:cob(I)alamin adenosyltransferase
MKGYVQVYTGDGKGKTTASLGLALRAAGAGLKVFIVQFLKKGDYSEINALSKFNNVTVVQYGSGIFLRGKPSEKDMADAMAGFKKLCEIFEKNEHDVVIADEANVAVMCGVLEEKKLLSLIDLKPENIELIITGRGATEILIQKADLVTEMKEVKHYYYQGVSARIGLEK